ncbi:MAG: nucleotide pyrophosphohydrolase [Phycisphaerae bacterium]|nr:nucleotide pyrophosphohydrolase [Phycisphaerae bacterium]MCZ2399439.1 nucleotide pyrophosphohydrolase [Phycisphaerae bacterium]
MQIREFQQRIEEMYSKTDRQRGSAATFLWLMEEVGELASAIAENNDTQNKAEEFADVLAWLCSLANVEGVDLQSAVEAKYIRSRPEGHK